MAELREDLKALRTLIVRVQKYSQDDPGGRRDAGERFLQLGWSHSTVPDLDAPVAPDAKALDFFPKDRKASHKLRDIFASRIGDKQKFRFKCDEWLNSRGEVGYIITVQAQISGKVYEYSQGYDAAGPSGAPSEIVEVSAPQSVATRLRAFANRNFL